MTRLASIRHLPDALIQRVMIGVNQLLSPLEIGWADPAPGMLPHPPVFIIGAPRTGSTLLYQLMVEYFDVGYLSNAHCLLWGVPSWVERVVHPLNHRQPSDFTSEHGVVNGWYAPSECGHFWYRFFRRQPQYVPLDQADPVKMDHLRLCLHALSQAGQRSLLFKNLPCALRLEPLVHALPEALFIVIHRDRVETALSLLNGRRKCWGRYDKWWSSQPPEIERLRTLPSHEQVVEQVRAIERVIDRFRRDSGSDRFVDVRYEALCDDVQATMERLDTFFVSHGLRLGKRHAVPARFVRQHAGGGIPEMLERNVRRYVATVAAQRMD